MTTIAHYSDVLNDNMIAAWPRVAAALEGLDCTLMGGTAVAMVLRHRHSLWVPIVRSWALTRHFALHPGTRNRYEIRYTRTQHRPVSPEVNDHGRVSGTHTARPV